MLAKHLAEFLVNYVSEAVYLSNLLQVGLLALCGLEELQVGNSLLLSCNHKERVDTAQLNQVNQSVGFGVRALERLAVQLELDGFFSALVAPLQVDGLAHLHRLIAVFAEHFLDDINKAQLLKLPSLVEGRVELPNVFRVEHLEREDFFEQGSRGLLAASAEEEALELFVRVEEHVLNLAALWLVLAFLGGALVLQLVAKELFSLGAGLLNLVELGRIYHRDALVYVLHYLQFKLLEALLLQRLIVKFYVF